MFSFHLLILILIALQKSLSSQKQRGTLLARVDGQLYDPVISAKGDEWKKRRHILTPAFSANKTKLV